MTANTAANTNLDSAIQNTIQAPQMPMQAAQNPNFPALPINQMQQIPMSDGGDFEDGGEVSNEGSIGGSIRSFFSGINLLEAAISAFIVGGIIYTIQYYKFMMMMEKNGYSDLYARIQKLESAEMAKKAEMNAAGKMKKKQVIRFR